MSQEGQEVIYVLKLINDRLKDKEINWFFAGSSALFLEGLNIPVKEVYINTKDNIEVDKIYELFGEYARHSPNSIKYGNISLYLGRLDINGLDVYIVSNLKMNREGKWINFPYLKKRVIFDGGAFYIIPMKENLRIYRSINRKEDKEVIKAIEMFLLNH